VIESLDVVDSSVAEPSKKKVKKTKSDKGSRKTSQGSGVAKYAGAVMLGAAIGAVGTIWGLVSLPTDFFA
jgi:hypothetical protein